MPNYLEIGKMAGRAVEAAIESSPATAKLASEAFEALKSRTEVAEKVLQRQAPGVVKALARGEQIVFGALEHTSPSAESLRFESPALKRTFVVVKGDIQQVLKQLETSNNGGKLLLREEFPNRTYSRELKTWVQHRDGQGTIPFDPVTNECDLLISCHPETITDSAIRAKHVFPDHQGRLYNRFQGTTRIVPGEDKAHFAFDVLNGAYAKKFNLKVED